MYSNIKNPCKVCVCSFLPFFMVSEKDWMFYDCRYALKPLYIVQASLWMVEHYNLWHQSNMSVSFFSVPVSQKRGSVAHFYGSVESGARFMWQTALLPRCIFFVFTCRRLSSTLSLRTFFTCSGSKQCARMTWEVTSVRPCCFVVSLY